MRAPEPGWMERTGPMTEHTGESENKSENNFIAAIFSRCEQRLSLLTDLCQSLEQSKISVLADDVNAVLLHTAQQHALYRSLQNLDLSSFAAKPHATLHEISIAAHEAGFNHVPAEDEERWAGLTRRLKLLENEVRRLAMLYAALLRRALRTADIWSRVLMSAAPTYSPSPQSSLALASPSFGPNSLSGEESR